MAYFTRIPNGFPSYYIMADNSGSVGAAAFLLGASATSGDDRLSIEQALTNASLAGIFIFSPKPLEIGDATAQGAFARKIWSLAARAPASRGFIWISDPETLTDRDLVPYLGLASDGSSLASGLSNGLIVSAMSMSVASGMKVSLLDDTTVQLTGSSSSGIGFSGDDAPRMLDARTGEIPFNGPSRGCIGFLPYIERRSLNDEWNWGFHFISKEERSETGVSSEWLPLAGVENGSDMIGFSARFDLADTLNTIVPLNGTASDAPRSGLWFTGSNIDRSRTLLRSHYRTVSGDKVTLYPVGTDTSGPGLATAGFIFSVGERVSETTVDFHAGPFGDFVVDTPPGPNGTTAELLCGLSGAEFVSVLPGQSADTAARMRFFPYKPAYTDVFPPVVASPTGPQTDTLTLLTSEYTTSWVAIMPPAAGQASYAAQPSGAALFGYDPYVWAKQKDVLGHVDPGQKLPSDGSIAFPMVPYAGFQPSSLPTGFDEDKSRDFESMIVGPTRRGEIGPPTGDAVLSARAHASGKAHFSGLAASGARDGETRFTTPSGLIATIDTASGSADWLEILLGQITTPEASTMAFEKPTEALQGAFQTNDLFLVVANDKHLVRDGGSFENTLNIGGWTLGANIGQSPQYGDYANVMIVKGRRGRLYDPDLPKDQNLVANPSKWTSADVFAAPTTLQRSDTPDSAQLINLSQWLQDYFEDALAQPDKESFRAFNDIARDENWTGVIVLRAKIVSPPSDLAGISAGVRDVDRYYAHHFAIRISQIRSDPNGGGISIDGQSSVYGLIYYEDSAYVPPKTGEPVQPVVPQPAADYDFITLTLKVLFENTSVKTFSSYTQLTMNRLFGSLVTDMGTGGNPYNSVVLAGTFQDNNDKPTYGMKTAGDFIYNMTNNVLEKVEIISAEMLTIAPGPPSTQIWFSLNGFLGFHVMKTIESEPVDYYSFGGETGKEQPRTGLSFSKLGLEMSFDTPDPNAPPEVVRNRIIDFNSSQIGFNIQASTPRPGSLFEAFSLDLEGLVSGPSDGDSPAALGYLDVVTNARMGGLGKTWNGLKFRLNLGSAGELAGKLGLNAYLLLAWAPDSTAGPDVNNVINYRATTGLHMPGTSNGAPLISLQNVLAMSYGTIQLLYEDKPGTLLHPATLHPLVPRTALAGPADKQFMLLLNEIAIKFMGLLKLPPNGSTAFYLFGDADPGAKDKTGLGWYAAYNNEPKKQDDAETGGTKP
ncbi:hypothetical protein [Roseibium sp.]|uniref:hypothetical protein n=1 Tax=Roseibium sp. TaxID=1936156 RepID=UPI003263B6EF